MDKQINKSRLRFILIIFLMFFSFINIINATLNVPITIKEVSQIEFDNYPTTVVVPLEKEKFYDVNHFQILDKNNNTVPAQFNILNKW